MARVRNLIIETQKIQNNAGDGKDQLNIEFSVDPAHLKNSASCFVSFCDGTGFDPYIKYDIHGVTTGFEYFSGSADLGESPNGLASNSRFGASVDIWEQVVVVGCSKNSIFTNDVDMENGGYNSSQGGIYIFSSSTGTTIGKNPVNWVVTGGLSHKVQNTDDYFGHDVSIHKNYIAIGAPSKDGPYGTSKQGAVYIFKSSSTGWSESTGLYHTHSSDGMSSAHFGYSVSLFEDKVLAGAPKQGANDYGNVYYFKRDKNDNWKQKQELSNPKGTPTSSDFFGSSIAMSGSVAVVGNFSFANSGSASNAGQAIIYNYNSTLDSWILVQTIEASDGAASDYFGWDVAISGDNIVVGAPNETGTYADNGAAYVFENISGIWTQVLKVSENDPDGRTDGYFGHSVSIFQNMMAIGAWKQNVNGSGASYKDTGFVYAYLSGSSGWVGDSSNPLTSSLAVAAPSAARPQFGYDVAVNGEYIVAGDPKGMIENDEDGTQAGNVGMFKLNTTKTVVKDTSRAKLTTTTAGYNVIIDNIDTGGAGRKLSVTASMSAAPDADSGGIWADAILIAEGK